ncbi:MAG: chemotaxis protein CheW [Spirochaetota bacterium]
MQDGQFLTFRLADETYGIAVRSIREILECQRITRIPRSADYLLGVMNVRGRVVPVVDLRVKFGAPAAEITVDTAIIVLELDDDGRDSLIGVLVDTVEEVIELDAECIEPPPRVGTSVDGRLLAGMGKRDDRFILLLRIDGLFTDEDVELARTTSEQEADEPGEPVGAGSAHGQDNEGERFT